MSDDNKIVPFPAHKARKSTQTDPAKLEQQQSQGRRITIMVSLVSTVFMATLINSRLNVTHNRDEGGRTIASSENNVTDFNEDLLLAKKIARESLRQPASRGREPTSEEKLRFEAPLNGSYLINMNEANGALESIEFIENSAQIRKLPDRAKFLIDNKDLLKIDFDAKDLKAVVSIQDKFKFEVYELKLKNKEQPAARVHFKFDKDGYFISMKVERISSST